MPRWIVVGVVAMLLSIGSAFAAEPVDAVARRLAEKELAEPLFHEHMEDFRRWRETIPDYDRRLYERVAKGNTQNVKLMRVIAVGFALTLLAIYLHYRFLSRRLHRLPMGDGPATASQPDQTRTGAPSPSPLASKAVASRLDDLGVLIDDYRQHTGRLDRLAADFDSMRAEIARHAESAADAKVGKRLAAMERTSDQLRFFLSDAEAISTDLRTTLTLLQAETSRATDRGM
jgi:hypothetical protein